jgi:hypothetical protein
MIVVRIVAVLLIVAFVLVLVFFGTRNRRYLQWAWRLFVLAMIGMLGLMLFYFVERLMFPPAPTVRLMSGDVG